MTKKPNDRSVSGDTRVMREAPLRARARKIKSVLRPLNICFFARI